jgi:hypothetical protein
MSAPLHYVIKDRRTGAIVGKAATLKGARRSVDRRDNEFGGYRFQAVAVFADSVKTAF